MIFSVSEWVRKEFIRRSGTSVLYLRAEHGVRRAGSGSALVWSYFLLRCWSCWTVRSREVRLSLSGMVEVAPLQPRGVAREPFSFTTTSESSSSFISAGSELGASWE